MSKTAVSSSNLVQLATRVPFDLHKQIKLHCVKGGTSVRAFVQEALEKALNKAKK